MTTDEGSGWVVEPPSADTSRISINVSDTNQLTPEVRDALDALVRAMEAARSGDDAQEEVEGFRARCPRRTTCDPQSWIPCEAKTIIDCVIKPCPRAFMAL